MKNKLLYMTIGALLGVVVVQWSCSEKTTGVQAVPAQGIIFAADVFGTAFLDENGTVWVGATNVQGVPVGWAQSTSVPALPVSVGEIKFWMRTSLITKDDVLWQLDSSLAPAPAEWKNLGP